MDSKKLMLPNGQMTIFLYIDMNTNESQIKWKPNEEITKTSSDFH